MYLVALLSVLLAFAHIPSAEAAGPANQQILEQQRTALQRLQQFDGVWRGEAKIYNADGTTLNLTQAERVGPMLDGAIRVIEGRGYTPDGTLAFNAFAVISFAPATGKYTLRSHAQGFAGDFPLEVRDDGFGWSIQAGPATLRYTSTVKNGLWLEVGERLETGRPPVKTFEMQLRRVAGTDWPAAGAPGPR